VTGGHSYRPNTAAIAPQIARAHPAGGLPVSADDFLEPGDNRLPIIGGELGVEHGIGLDLWFSISSSK